MSKASVARKSRPENPAAEPTRTALDDLAMVSLEVYGMAQKIELLQFAQIGLCRSFASLKVDHDLAEEYFDLVSNALADLHGEAGELSRRLVDTGQRLHRLCGERPS